MFIAALSPPQRHHMAFMAQCSCSSKVLATGAQPGPLPTAAEVELRAPMTLADCLVYVDTHKEAVRAGAMEHQYFVQIVGGINSNGVAGALQAIYPVGYLPSWAE